VIIGMRDGELSVEQIRAFLEASRPIDFEGKKRQEVYEGITGTLRRQRYREQGEPVRGLLKRYVAKMTRRSRAQVTRLVGRYLEHSEVKPSTARRHSYASRFTRGDLELLARVDEAHETLSGPGTKKILEREFQQYQNAAYERLASISAAHIYNLRKRRHYRECWMNYTKTRPVQVSIGERRRPQPEGKPGYLRVDTAHQGDLDGIKGVYHINAVDEVTQWQVVGSVAAVTQSHLEPVFTGDFAAVSVSHPRLSFRQRLGVHQRIGIRFAQTIVDRADQVAPAQEQRHGLVESKNGAVIRKHMGYGYIAQAHAPDIHVFYQRSFNPYLNFHRPWPSRHIEPYRSTGGPVNRNGSSMRAAKRSSCTGVTPRHGKPCANCSRLCRKDTVISSRNSASRAWTGSPTPTATPSQPGVCNRPSERCSSASSRGGKAHDARFT
jgi:hypothetical protein